MKRFLCALVLVSFVVCSAYAAIDKSYLSKLPPLIDREVFFGNPEIAGAQISPDGSHISFIKPYRDILNIWVKKTEEPFESAKPVTADTTRPVTGYFWSRDSKFILYVQDKGGDENWHIYAVDPSADPQEPLGVPAARDLTPLPKITARIYALPKKDPGTIYVGLNDRDERYHDLYKLDVATGERTLLRRNETGIANWVFDLDGVLRLATKQTHDGGTEIFRIERDTLVSIISCSGEEMLEPIAFHPDGKRVYIDSNMGADVDLSRLMLLDPSTGKMEFIEADPENEVDFAGAEFSELDDRLIATYYIGDRLRIYFKDPLWEKLYKNLEKKLPDGDLYISSRTADDRLWIVSVTSDVDPGAAYLFDTGTGKVTFLYRPRPKLPIEHLANMKPLVYKARDGLTIHAYLTVPKGVKPKKIPVIVMPHGGPWHRDQWGYDPEAQFFANRGYAVFQPNFRASTGYGKAFFNAGRKQWGDAMQNDLTDGVAYLVSKGIADPEQVVIYGGSYGGYATLAGLAFTPEIYAAGISYVGPSSLITLLNSIPPYWEVIRNLFNEHVGDPNKPEDAERLIRQSPLYSAEKIVAPLLVVQGANDPRVKKAESDQIVAKLRDLGRSVEYIVAPDEGHGFRGAENRVAFYAAAERFLARHIGGRYQEDMPESIRKKLEDITVDVSTVKLPEPAGSARSKETSQLPICNGSLLHPLSLSYTGQANMGAETISFELMRKLSRMATASAEIFRVTSEQKATQGAALDTFDMDAATMAPIRWSAVQGPASVELSFSESSVIGHLRFGGREMPVNVSLEAPVFGDGSSLEVLLGTLPLAQGYSTVLRVYDFQIARAKALELHVLSLETVSVPAGTFECWRVELSPIEEEGKSVVFINTKDPHVMIRGEFALPASAGGGSATMELSRIN